MIILHESESELVINKPGGVLTQAPPGIDSLEQQLRRFLAQRETRKDFYLAACHRLDRPVSGAILFARNRAAAKQIGRQFEQRFVQKTYWALVQGDVQPDRGTWTDFMRKIPGVAQSETVSPDHPEAQLAMLDYGVLRRQVDATNRPFTWLEIEPGTGRTHQIRIQASCRGHPVLGDELYGSDHLFGLQLIGPGADDPRQRSIALHARRLRFRGVAGGEIIDIMAPVFGGWPELS